MTTFLLIRHAAHDLLGHTLAGRTRDIALNARGARDAEDLIAMLAPLDVRAIYASPRQRATATIEPFASRSGLDVGIEAGLDEIDFGAWSGQRFADLERDPQWSVWCNARTRARPPGGESICEVQGRVVAAIHVIRVRHPDDEVVALVSHGDVIKAALAHYLDLELDHLERLDVAPASVSIVIDDGSWSQLRLVNATPRWPP